MKERTRHITMLLIIAILFTISIMPTIYPVHTVAPGNTITYEVTICNYGNVTTKTVTYRIISVKSVGGAINITWENDEGKQGFWVGESFGNPVTYPGEKWESTNRAFYDKVNYYKTILYASVPPLSSKINYNFEMEFFYLEMFKFLPRSGKRYSFVGIINVSVGTYFKLIHNVSYFDNGVAYKMYYEKSIDTNGNFIVDDNERYYEIWQLVDWNMPYHAALSPIAYFLVYIGLLAFIVLELRFIVRKYAPIIYKAAEEAIIEENQ
ncbi:MAG: hypothetical protein J7L07_09345 [Candidatus Odinarchaeota archaeon]|nr:hypothetical protein [Candidatus Odinarchaeota archaeon]